MAMQKFGEWKPNEKVVPPSKTAPKKWNSVIYWK